jgi:hypothetical protein
VHRVIALTPAVDARKCLTSTKVALTAACCAVGMSIRWQSRRTPDRRDAIAVRWIEMMGAHEIQF